MPSEKPQFGMNRQPDNIKRQGTDDPFCAQSTN